MVTPPTLSSEPAIFLECAWRRLVAFTWEVDADTLAARVPPGLELDRFEGRTLVSLVGFLFLDTRALGIPLWFHRRFPEVNLRFYVRRQGPEGSRQGVVFVKEIVPRWAIAAGARWLFGEPYCTMPMRHVAGPPDAEPRTGEALSYEWRNGGRWHRLSARIGAPIGPDTSRSVHDFVIERYWGFSRRRDGGSVEYRVRHPPWRLWSVEEPRIEMDAARLCGPQLGEALAGPPRFAVIADGSPVTVSWGTRL
jgi:uncharacterized protein YqjF (DUF2071 family)